ncbi:U-box domain-containing protein 21 [Striga hermonthica]|uniref:U-box domain-containing protein n=1 Tax=Striga hermonthica TaxID=68872 RepID=A0A9N7R788_STRHE|nr:U-box domain-containing protein 21 [Striga hermonthica]
MTCFLWQRRRNRNSTGKNPDPKRAALDTELTIPTDFRCPISLDLMKDPVSLSTGITYDRDSIERWLDSGHARCPVTNQPLRTLDQIPNHALRKMIQEWCVDNRSLGVERVPTPRVPISPQEVSDICAEMRDATETENEQKCRELVAKIKDSACESERNRRCISSNGIGAASAGAFEAFARVSVEKHSVLLREILSVLTWAFPQDAEGCSKVGSAAGLRCLVRFLGGGGAGGSLSSRRDAALRHKSIFDSFNTYEELDNEARDD